MLFGTPTRGISACLTSLFILISISIGCGDENSSDAGSGPVLAPSNTGSGVMSPPGMANITNTQGGFPTSMLGGTPMGGMVGLASGMSGANPMMGGSPIAPNQPVSPTVAATMRVLNPGSFGGGYSGVTATSEYGTGETDTTGMATVDVSQGAYSVRLTAGNARPHTVYGVAGSDAFTQITYMSPEMITGYVFDQLGINDDPSKGILVVGLDTPSLAPAVGASATINLESGDAFTFAANAPTPSDEILGNGQGFITFPNVTPGQVQIETLFPRGACRVFPAERGVVDVTVTAGEVSVIAYICRSN